MLDFSKQSTRRFCTALICMGVVLVAILPCVEGLLLVELADPSTALWFSFIGKLHPVFLHLPIGIFAYVGFCELLSLVTRERCKVDVTLALLLGSAAAVAATICGYLLYLTGEYSVTELMQEHKRDGLVFTLMALCALFAKLRSAKAGAKKVWSVCYGIFITAAMLMLICAGHHGGEISHGDPFEAWPPSVEIVEVAPEYDPLVYEDLVESILSEKCVKCHGEEKQKGGLRVDTIAYMLKGGDQGASLVPGYVDDSLLTSCLHLPLDDDLRMPPEGKPQLTNEEIKTLELWVRAGAPAGVRLGSLGKP